MKAGGEVAALREALGSARLVLRIFFSLNSPGLTEVRPPRTEQVCEPNNMMTSNFILF